MHVDAPAILFDLDSTTWTRLADFTNHFLRLLVLLSTSLSVFACRFITAEALVPISLAHDAVRVIAGCAGEDDRVARLRRIW